MFCCNAAQGVSSPSPEMATTSALHTNNLRPALSTSPQATITRAALPIRYPEALSHVYGPEHLILKQSQVLASSEVRTSGTRKRRMITPSTIATAKELIPMRYAPVPSPPNTPKSIATITGPRTEATIPTVT